MSTDIMKDFDVLVPATRTAKIGGEVIDVTIVPARAALKFIDFSKKYNVNKIEGMNVNSFESGMIDDVLEVIEIICKRSSEKITANWLLDNVDVKILIQFIQFVFEGMKSDPAEEVTGESGKN